MPEARLPTHVWVEAELRRCSAEGIGVVVIHKGERMGGTVMLKIYQHGVGCRLLSQMRDLDGRLAWYPPHKEAAIAESEADERIRRALAGSSRNDGVSIRYIVPWTDATAIPRASVDAVLSHAVLGEVGDPGSTYRSIHSWLRPGGFMSHQIGFGFHGFTGRWNGYWAVPEPLWHLIKGRRAFTVNRLPCSAHLALIAQTGFDPLCVLKNYNASGIQRSELSARWRDLSDEDLYCESLFVQARKKPLTSVRAAA